MKKFLKRTRIGFIGGIYLMWCYFTWIVPYSNHPEKYPLEKRYKKARKLVTFIMKNLKAEVRLTNRPVMDNDPKLFVCNHVDMFDPLFLVAFSPKPICFISKIENEKVPFVGRILKAMGALFIDRNDPRQAIRIFQQAQKIIEDNAAHICIFPEGTRNRHPYEKEPIEFHPGSFKIAQRGKIPVIPVSVFGTDGLLNNDLLHRHYLVQYRFFDKIDPSYFASKKTTDLAEDCHKIIVEEFLKQRETDRAYYANKEYKGKKPKWWKDPAIIEDYEK